MLRTSTKTLGEYNDVSHLCASMKGGLYQNRRAEKTLKALRSPTGVIVEGHLKRVLEEQGFRFDSALDNKSVYDPSKLWVCLSRYSERAKLSYNKDAWDRAYDVTLKEFVGSYDGKVETDSSYEGLLRSVKLNKASGAPYFQKKSEAFHRDYQLSQRIAEGSKKPVPTIAYHRVQHGDEGPKTRLVWGYPQSMTLLEARFARPLVEHFRTRRTCMAFAYWRIGIAARLTPIENSSIRYAIDFSKFDATLSPELISMAFDVLRRLLVLDGKDEEVWNLVVNYFIHTPILMPDGYVYRKHTGVPSGSYFTQLVDSICNYFITQYTIIRITKESIREGEILVLGDDSIFNSSHYVKIESICKVAAELGVTVSETKSTIVKWPQPVPFLGHLWKHGIVDRDIEDLVKRIVYPEKHSRDYESVRDRQLVRTAAFVADAITAWPLFMKIWGARTPDAWAHTFGLPWIIRPITGWEEFKLSQSEDDTYSQRMSELMYTSILK